MKCGIVPQGASPKLPDNSRAVIGPAASDLSVAIGVFSSLSPRSVAACPNISRFQMRRLRTCPLPASAPPPSTLRAAHLSLFGSGSSMGTRNRSGERFAIQRLGRRATLASTYESSISAGRVSPPSARRTPPLPSFAQHDLCAPGKLSSFQRLSAAPRPSAHGRRRKRLRTGRHERPRSWSLGAPFHRRLAPSS